MLHSERHRAKGLVTNRGPTARQGDACPGERYEGAWRGGRPQHGQGTYTTADGGVRGHMARRSPGGANREAAAPGIPRRHHRVSE